MPPESRIQTSRPSSGARYSDADLTVVVVGVPRPDADRFAKLAEMRAAFPNATYLLSTSRAEARTGADLSYFDRIVIQEGPGLISSDKFDHGSSDINEVKAFIELALAECRTALTVVLKPGSFLFSQKAMRLWLGWLALQEHGTPADTSRILVSKFFTLNPRYDERLPFQVGTTFQLGLTSDLRRFWSAPEYDFATASWYENHSHAAGSLPRERAFRARYTPDQWMTLHYLYADGRFPIRYHNDISTAVLDEFERGLADRFIVAHPRDIDLHDADNVGMFFNTYVNMLCYSYWEWSRLAQRAHGEALDFPTHRFWPREERERRAMIFARNRINRKLLGASRLLPKKLLRQIYG